MPMCPYFDPEVFYKISVISAVTLMYLILPEILYKRIFFPNVLNVQILIEF